MFIKYFIIHSQRICSLLILCWRQESSLTMFQFLFKISYHSMSFNFSFRNGDKVMSALRVWQHMRERKMVTLHSWLFYSNTHLLFLITIKKKKSSLFFQLFFPGMYISMYAMAMLCVNQTWVNGSRGTRREPSAGSLMHWDRKCTAYGPRLIFISCKLILESKECLPVY